jgi:hypothetical protein
MHLSTVRQSISSRRAASFLLRPHAAYVLVTRPTSRPACPPA